MRDAAAQLSEPRLRARPRLHFTAPHGWLNDPNGLITWRDRYHLFYQHNPYGTQHRTIHWGHAVSEDLLAWRHLPEALTPAPLGADRDGCFSGHAILHHGSPALIYSGHRDGGDLPCLAFPNDLDQLTTWDKYPGNPVIAHPPDGFGHRGFRDHCVWREGAEYYQVIGSSTDDGRGAALLYRSPDLIDWRYLGPLFVAPDTSLGWMWECPDFFPLGDRWVLIVSMLGGDRDHSVAYLVGDFRDGVFHPELQGTVDNGARLYAPQTFLDREGRRVLLGWLREDQSEIGGADWCGMMSLPRMLSLDTGGRLRSEPLPDLAGQRKGPLPLSAVNAVTTPVPDTEAPLEIEVTGAGGYLRLRYQDPDLPAVTVRWSAPEGVRVEIAGAPAPLPPAPPSRGHAGDLRVFLDGGTIEAYAAGSAAAGLVHAPDTRLASVEIESGALSDHGRVKVWELQAPTSVS